MPQSLKMPGTTCWGDMGTDIAVSVMSVSKRYQGIQALSDVSLDLLAGEVHGIVGGNGAGKSTLIKIITGAERADSGQVRVATAGEGAVAAIYQELTIVPEMTAIANVFLGSSPVHRSGILDRKAMEREFSRLSKNLNAQIDGRARAGELSVADQQLLEIMRALVGQHQVIIMDEPTASLGAVECERLYKVFLDLKSKNTAVVFIGHDLDEVLETADRVSVLRDGQLVASDLKVNWTKPALIQAMLGSQPIAEQVRTERSFSGAALRADNREVRPGFPWSFQVRKGEILGIAGLVGSGRTRLLRALAGLNPSTEGTITFDGLRESLPRSVRAAIRRGIVLTPEDRKGQGLVLSLSGEDNLCLPNLRAVSNGWLSRRRMRRTLAEMLATSMGFANSRLPVAAGTLSGGNQQKLAIGKWLRQRPRVLLLDEPTRGIDIGAKSEIYQTIKRLCAQGMSVVVVSSELAELSDHCDRILVISRGRMSGEIQRPDISVARMTQLIFEAESQGQGATR